MSYRLALIAGLLLLPAAPLSAIEPKLGETVIAYWAQSVAHFIGTAVEKQGGGYLVVFEDGDTGTVAAAQIRKFDLKDGSKVMARFSDGKYYSAKIAKTVGKAFFIRYDDGDELWVPWSSIALK